MDISFLNTYFIPLVMAACLVIGYCIKHISWLYRISNEYIPAILALCGALLAVADAGSASLEIIIKGAVTGLASTGLYEAFSQLINKYSERKDCDETKK